MTTLTTSFTRVDHLQTGQHIRYYGETWIVLQVLPVHVTGGHGIIGYLPATGERRILLYANPAAIAELVL